MDYQKLLLTLSILSMLSVSGCAQQAKPTLYGQPLEEHPLEVTVYNSNLGVVKQVRTLSLEDGVNKYYNVGVASSIDPTSVKLSSDDGSFSVLEQNYQYDLVNKAKILQKYLGKKITGYTVVGDTKEVVEGVLLASSGNELIIQKPDDSIEVLYVNDLKLPKLPQGLIVQPTLEWLIANNGAGDKKARLSYMTSGMGWTADYVLVVDDGDTSMDLNGWVTVTNNAGTTFEDAKLKLVAGDVNRATAPAAGVMYKQMDMAYEMAAPQFQEQQLFEYHMYDLQRPTTLKDREQKQISLFTAEGAAVEKEYVYEAQSGWYYTQDSNKKVQVKLNFKNSKDQGLGMPLPKGKIRVFKEDSQGQLQFVGEDQIDHTPKDETVRILVGNAFDIVGERKRMDIKDHGCQHDVSWEVTLRNHKDEDVTVTVIEKSGWDWQILRENYDHIKESNERIRYNIPVKADDESKLSYTIRYNNC